jgi:hypothetical protein
LLLPESLLCHYCPPDDFGDLRDDGIAERSKSVHPCGYPIRRSIVSGDKSIPKQPGHFFIEGQSWFAFAVGVATNPEARPPVIMSDGTSRNFKRWRDCVSEALQISHHFPDCHSFDVSNILTNDPIGPAFRNNSQHLRPEIAVTSVASSRSA